jgi:hypothetical protein
MKRPLRGRIFGFLGGGGLVDFTAGEALLFFNHGGRGAGHKEHTATTEKAFIPFMAYWLRLRNTF